MPKFLRKDVGGLAPDASELYYTILINNNNVDASSNASGPIPLKFNETRSNPYVGCAGDYFMSVISYQLDTIDVPLFIWDAVPGAKTTPALGKSSYWVTIVDENTGTAYQVNASWIPQDKTAPFPPVPIPNNYNNYPFYYAYTYDHVIGLFNTAISSAYSNAGGTSYAPFIVLDSNTRSVSIVGSQSEFQTPSPAYSLYFNTELYSLFSSTTAVRTNEASIKTTYGYYNMDYQIQFTLNPDGSNLKTVYTDFTSVPPSGGYNAVYNDSEYSPFPYWNPVESIVFTAQQLTLVPELIMEPTNYGEASNTNSNTDTNYILAEYATPLKTGAEYQPNIFYQPTSEFKLVELYGEEALNSLSIQVFWKDTFGSLHQLLLEPGGQAYIKLLFRKKSYYVGLAKE
jgi:hypothetical protein